MATTSRKLVQFDNTRFIFKTNFSGDPERDAFGSDARKVNVIIPDEYLAKDLIDEGFNVKQTRPRPGYEDEFVLEYYIVARINLDSEWPPRIYLVSGEADPVRLDAAGIGNLDKIYIRNVNMICNVATNKRTGNKSLYVKTLYVEQDVESDPYAERYRRR